jgi:hypothetical protein
MPEKMTYAAAAKLTGANRSSIKRGRDGESLISAETFAKILVKHFKLKGYSEIKNIINNDFNLNLYFESELGEKYIKHNSTPLNISHDLTKAVSCSLSKKIYGLIWAYKKVDISILEKCYPKKELDRVIKRLEKYNVLKNHESLRVIEFNHEYETDCIYFNAQQVKLAASNITPEKVEDSLSMYYQDTLLLSKKNENKLYNILLKQKNELVTFIKEMEEEEEASKANKTELVELANFYNHLETITSEKEEPIQ